MYGSEHPNSHTHSHLALYLHRNFASPPFQSQPQLQLELDKPTSPWAALATPRLTAGRRAFLRSPLSSTRHTVNEAEKHAYVAHINAFLAKDSYFGSRLPIHPEGDEVFEVVNKGVLLW